ncbi:TPA: hypothetical protein L3310_003626 [Vibrio cholerae]|uniref:hypothetical protein n=1 Tax=Vibrio cholerae TaxID=666 RepID=UPI0004E302D6|nr:hypothetical protein [Vibrio cholerae]KFE28850.1 hypothetical protein DN30_442 [Vibrio cholerae]TXY43904.1 hypothetical protein FXE84_00805 [Vibrio cholerae]HAS5696529.1 hypothetical protein [Vibrio cholerae]HBN6882698.1 hypothetical protein [Vibrio cholerae]HBN6886642.1 hypothetical protein [Vibrio cholerae]
MYSSKSIKVLLDVHCASSRIEGTPSYFIADLSQEFIHSLRNLADKVRELDVLQISKLATDVGEYFGESTMIDLLEIGDLSSVNEEDVSNMDDSCGYFESKKVLIFDKYFRFEMVPKGYDVPVSCITGRVYFDELIGADHVCKLDS